MKTLQLLALIAVFALTGCASSVKTNDPAIHGDAGVRIQSRDTHRVVPTPGG